MQSNTSHLDTASLTLHYFKVPVVITIIGILVRIIAYMWVLNAELNTLKRDFRNSAAIQTEMLKRDLETYKNGIILLRSFFDASNFVTEAEFTQYTKPLFSDAPFLYVAWIKYGNNKSYELIYQKGRAPQGFVSEQLPDIKHFDKKGMMFHGTYEDGPNLLLIAVPVLKRDGATGVVIGAVSLEKLLKIDTVWVDYLKYMSVYLYEKGQLEEPFYHLDTNETSFPQFGNRTEIEYSYKTVTKYSSYYVQHTIYFADREWQAVFVPTARYLSTASGVFPWIILLSGLIITALLGYTAFRITNENVHISGEVARKTHDLNESQKILKDREAYLHAVIENVPSMLFVKEGDELRFTEFNRAGRDLVGVSYETMIGKNDYDLFPKEQAEFLTSADKDVLDKGELKIIESEEIDTVSGKKLLYTKKVPLLLSDNRKFLLGISEDITERKEAEEQRERLVNRLTDSNAGLERFAYVASHDLQEPLRMIRSFSTKLQTHIEDRLENDKKGQRYFKHVTEGAELAQNLIQDILNYSSISKDTGRHQPVDITELVNVSQRKPSTKPGRVQGKHYI